MLSRPQEFAALQAGTVRSHPLLTARFLRTDLETTRFGLATGRKLGGAVVRNRVRRRLREVLRAMAPSFQPGWDVLIIARPAIVEADHRTLVETLRRLLQRGGVLGGQTSVVKRIGIGLIRLYRIVFGWLPVELPLRAVLLALHRAGDRQVRPPPRQLDGDAAGSRAATRVIPAATTRFARTRRGPRDTPAPPLEPRPAPARSWRSSPSPRPRRGLRRRARRLARARAAAGRHADAAGGDPARRRSRPTEPFSLLAWLFTPIFQAFFILLVVLDKLTGNIAIAIILMTIIIRIVLIPIFRRQTVSTQADPDAGARGQGDPAPLQGRPDQAAGGPAPALRRARHQPGRRLPAGDPPDLPADPDVLGLQPGPPELQPAGDARRVRVPRSSTSSAPRRPIVNAAGHVLNPCLDPIAFGVNWGVPEVIIGTAGSMLSGLSLLAVISSLFQLVQSRMTLPPHDPAMADDPNYKIQRQMAYIFPFISLIYGSFLPAGLFLYWITSTIFSIVQQYLIIGWGGMFPLFGWTPGFAQGHAPRFPVTLPPPVDPKTRPPTSPLGGSAGRAAQADKTIRHKERGRQGRRGRRR